MKLTIVDPEGVEIDALLASNELQGASLLDIGCGEGRYGNLLAPHCEFTAGFDLDPVELAAAKRSNPEVHYVAASATHVPFRSGFFDVALFGWSL